MVLGIGSFAHSTTQILKEDGAAVATYLTRDYGHFPPSLTGPTFSRVKVPNPCSLTKKRNINLMIPMSIDWAQMDWKDELLDSGVPIFGATGEGMRIERERDFARDLCRDFHIPVPTAFVAANQLAAERIVKKRPRPYVIKNPLCSPNSPVQTIVCETVAETRAWLKRVNYAEGVFLQDYLGRAEIGHIALVSAGEVYSVATNQEYKRAFAGDMGIVAGAPLGGIVELDPSDKYGLARELILPLRPWFREVGFHGPIQVTAVRHRDRWRVIEYNIRIGVTSGAMILRLLENPLEIVLATAGNKPLNLRFKAGLQFGCSITLAGYGYPYTQVSGPSMPVEMINSIDPDCDLWWNQVMLEATGKMVSDGQRIADVIGFAGTVEDAMAKALGNIRKIRSLGSYFRADIGQSLWPPGRPAAGKVHSKS